MQQELWHSELPSVLSEGFPAKMVLLDCETTGGKPTYHRITEIGLLTIDDGRISGRWQTLLNPCQTISPAITRLTGISNAMVKDAPLFEQIAAELLEYLRERVLVAHNVRFDLGFLKQEFSRIDCRYSPAHFCSAKLSRRLYPQFKRHGLDAIMRRHDLSIANRHRAFDDAQAIWQFFQKTSQLMNAEDIAASCQQLSKRPSLPSMLQEEQVKAIPKAPGVYIFQDEAGKPLYIGKSVNLYERVMSHFNQDYRNHKDMKMHTRIAHIETITTHSDFSAQMLESRLIKEQSPPFNQRLKKTVKLFQLASHIDQNGYQQIAIEAVDLTIQQSIQQTGLFRSRRQAQKRLEKLADDFHLCHKLIGLETWHPHQQTPCFRFQLHKCLGPCCAREKPQSYNLRVDESLSQFRVRSWPWPDAILLEEKSFDPDQPAHYHLINQWRYLGQVIDQSELAEKGYMPAQQTDFEKIDNENVQMEVQFDLDTYFILLRFLLGKSKTDGLQVIPLKRLEELSW